MVEWSRNGSTIVALSPDPTQLFNVARWKMWVVVEDDASTTSTQTRLAGMTIYLYHLEDEQVVDQPPDK